QILGAHAANLALTVLASGGIYLAGKLARRLRHELVSAAFLEPLLRAGMASEPLERVPVYVLRRDVALLGAAHERLRRWTAGGPGAPRRRTCISQERFPVRTARPVRQRGS